jgi:hypothetical protein
VEALGRDDPFDDASSLAYRRRVESDERKGAMEQRIGSL